VLAAADIAVVASETPETFGLSVVESMACACPVIVSDVSLFPELVGRDNRHLVFTAASASSLASALSALVAYPAPQRQQLGRRLRERAVTCFPLEQTVAGYLALFQKNVAIPSCLQ
jgi:glycosyltransferase involved in cell wall biosynthesis